MKMLKLSSFLFLFLFSNNVIQANHIIGGEMNYRCLGNNKYEVTLRVVRDCHTGIAPFDYPAILAVFDAQSKKLLFEKSMLYDVTGLDTSLILPDSCKGGCTVSAIYKHTLTLPKNSSGYIMSYQRCCRSHDVSNIINPDSIGMALQIELTPLAMNGCNNSPFFSKKSPLPLIAYHTFSVNMSATDIDGDSLVYKLYAPFEGASFQDPKPSPPNPPPYDTVTYTTGFNSQSPIPSTPSITYNPNTGILSGVTTKPGTYLVGFSVLEFDKKGNMLSQTFQEFSILVRLCAPVWASVKNNNPKQIIDIYPNPSNNIINLRFNKKILEISRITILNMNGQVVKELSHFSGQIDVSDLSSGVHIIQITTPTAVITKRWIKE